MSGNRISQIYPSSSHTSALLLQSALRPATSHNHSTRTSAGSPTYNPHICGLDYHGKRRTSVSGGDFFDFVAGSAAHLALGVGAVSSDGPDSALMVSSIEAILCSLCADPASGPAYIVQSLNRFVCGAPDETLYAPFFYASIDSLRRELCYLNAGHESALLLRKRQNRAIRLERNGAVLGLTHRSRYGQRTIPLEPGDLLVVFSEGVAEAFDTHGRPFGFDGVLSVLRRSQHARVEDLVEEILDASERHAGGGVRFRDHTVAAVRFTGRIGEAVPAEDAETELAFAAA
jgi:sigma-B regulation protein RsbU (phosphoserine phosphatase)